MTRLKAMCLEGGPHDPGVGVACADAQRRTRTRRRPSAVGVERTCCGCCTRLATPSCALVRPRSGDEIKRIIIILLKNPSWATCSACYKGPWRSTRRGPFSGFARRMRGVTSSCPPWQAVQGPTKGSSVLSAVTRNGSGIRLSAYELTSRQRDYGYTDIRALSCCPY